MMAKSATLPLSSWLPDAGVAPSPVTALLHAAVLVKIGVYVFARLFPATVTVSEKWHWIVPLIAGISAFVSAGAAMVETDIKRIIAYSTISQIGFIFLGLSISTTIGVIGGLLYILMHGIAKGGLFLCAGIVEQNTHIKDITKLGGLIKTFPVTAISFLLCALSVMGIPPFGGFWSKAFVIAGAAKSHQYLLTAFFVVSAMMTMLYLLRVFSLVFLGDAKPGAHDDHPPREGSRVMVGSVAFLAVLAILSGLFVYLPSELVVKAVRSFGGIQ
jgi:NADH:ubiquinone oxidoreductase subunit 5 (subunit L)/multisubunit Na+/H+ antiporter MnhA subunit